MVIEKEFVFDAAHFLPYVPQNHKCRRLHGHTYRVTLGIEGEVDEKGWIIDFAAISEAMKPLFQKIDHNLLNAVEGLDNPTAENIARWIFDNGKKVLPFIAFVIVQEGASSRAVYPGRQ